LSKIKKESVFFKNAASDSSVPYYNLAKASLVSKEGGAQIFEICIPGASFVVTRNGVKFSSACCSILLLNRVCAVTCLSSCEVVLRQAEPITGDIGHVVRFFGSLIEIRHFSQFGMAVVNSEYQIGTSCNDAVEGLTPYSGFDSSATAEPCTPKDVQVACYWWPMVSKIFGLTSEESVYAISRDWGKPVRDTFWQSAAHPIAFICIGVVPLFFQTIKVGLAKNEFLDEAMQIAIFAVVYASVSGGTEFFDEMENVGHAEFVMRWFYHIVIILLCHPVGPVEPFCAFCNIGLCGLAVFLPSGLSAMTVLMVMEFFAYVGALSSRQ